MSASAAEFHFAAEFVTFLAAAAGLAVVLLRGELFTTRPAVRGPLALGFAGIAAAAFLHGSLLVDDARSPGLAALRLAGVALVAAGSRWWAGPPTARRLLWLGLGFLAAGAVASLAGAGNGGSALLAAGGAALGGATVMASRGAVAARVAASAALTLLLVVLVLAVGLSAVLTSTVEGQAKARLSTRAANEAKFISDPVVPRLDDAKIVGASLKSDRLPELRNTTDPNAARELTDAVTSLSNNFLEGRPAAYIDANT